MITHTPYAIVTCPPLAFPYFFEESHLCLCYAKIVSVLWLTLSALSWVCPLGWGLWQTGTLTQVSE